MKRSIFGLVVLLIVLPTKGAEESRLDKLTGIIKKDAKALSPCILKIDGGHQIGLRGEALKNTPDGSRIWVQGVLHTCFYDNRSDPNPVMMPVQWHIYMDVRGWKGITKPFERPED